MPRNGTNGTNGRDDGRDKFALYQRAVQNPPFEVRFLRRTFGRMRGREPLKLREDFCGSALLSCEWVRRVDGGTAVGIDLDGATLDYARRVNVAALGAGASRVTLLRQDVLEARGGSPDIVVAYNFSWFVFKTRDVLRRYFRRVYEALAPDGVFVADIFGGPEAQAIQEEVTEYDDFTYVWDQARFNPVTHEILCHIHFGFPGGRRIKRAFTYDWRLWTLPEVADLLVETGFEPPTIFWEGTDHGSGGGNGVFRPSVKGDNSQCFVAYIVAAK